MLANVSPKLAAVLPNFATCNDSVRVYIYTCMHTISIWYDAIHRYPEMHKMRAFLLLLSSSLLLLLATAAASEQPCDAGDNAALLAVKAAFNNASYFVSWTPDITCCDWFGIECDNSTGRVVSLALLRDDQVTGPVPGDAIARLTGLQRLKLFMMPGVYGPIPTALANLSALTELTIYWTGVSGPVPPFLGALTELKTLDLSFNWLTGAIPPSLAALPHLIRINVSRNYLSFDMSRLELPERLDTLDVSHNKIHGGIPAQVTWLSNLKLFNVSYNRLCGEVPSGGNMARFDQYCYQHNKCLCGAPLAPCH